MDEKARTDSMFTRECFKYGDTMIINMIIKKQIETNENKIEISKYGRYR